MKRKQPGDTFLLVCLNEDFWFIRFQIAVHLEALHKVFSLWYTEKRLCYNIVMEEMWPQKVNGVLLVIVKHPKVSDFTENK